MTNKDPSTKGEKVKNKCVKKKLKNVLNAALLLNPIPTDPFARVALPKCGTLGLNLPHSMPKKYTKQI